MGESVNSTASNRTHLAFVTGATSGIGRATAIGLLDRGWRVIGAARRPSAITHPAYDHIPVDLADSDQLSDQLEPRIRAETTSAGWRRVGLVNNAARADLLGPTEDIDPGQLAVMLALNVVAPVWLMGAVLSHAPRDAAVRIVNLSTGAAVRAFPGLSAYACSKAALRMAGMVLATELESPERLTAVPTDVAILSYEPGTVDTPMQDATRSTPIDVFPWRGIFDKFKADGLLVAPERPAAEIADFLDSSGHPRFTERRFGRP